MSDVYAQFSPFLASWRQLRPDIVVRIGLLRNGAILAGKLEELEKFLAALDAIVEGLRRGEVAPLSDVYRCCHIVRGWPARDELIERVGLLAVTYKHTLFITRPLPSP